MYDIHPFNRPFTGEPWEAPQVIKSYQETMPHCHWRVQDLVNAMAEAQLTIKEVEKINNWEYNPMAALPAWISIVAQK